jgi:NiFe hydrogenase small subunit HydA
MTSPRKSPRNLLWLQSGGCGGCSLSLLCAESPDVLTTLEAAGVHLLWHPSLSEASGEEFRDLLEHIKSGDIPLDILCLEGAVIRGPAGTGRFHLMAGTGLPMMAWIDTLAQLADYVVAVGSCAAYGGITAGGGNPSDACGLQYEGAGKSGLLGEDFRARGALPVINISGCPTHPNWVTETLMQIAAGQFTGKDIDALGRPRSYADHLVHHGCPRNEYYEFKASAEKTSDLGCLMEHMGCLGTQAHADCNTRLWNGEGSCLRGGYACINCTAPGFEEPGHGFSETPKLAGIPLGLPTDMPKAWFVALASLSKAATPKRLKENAVSDHIRVSPGSRPRKRS